MLSAMEKSSLRQLPMMHVCSLRWKISCTALHKNLQKRTFGLIENGSWAPCAAKGMKGILEGMKEVNICENVVSIKSTMKDTDVAKMEELAKEILA